MQGLLAAVIPALLAAVGFWWKQRRDRHDIAIERHRVFTEVREEIDVIEAWLKAYSLVAPPEPGRETSLRARRNLESAYERLEESLQVAREVPERVAVRGYLGIFLLKRKLASRSAEIARLCYYLSLGWAFVVNLFAIFLIFSPHSGMSEIAWVIFVLIFWIVFAFPGPIGFFMLTNRRDRRARAEDAKTFKEHANQSHFRSPGEATPGASWPVP